MAQVVKTNKLYPKSKRRRTTTTLTGVTKGSKAPGLNIDVRGHGSRRSSYRR